MFKGGADAVNTVLRRAALSGIVKVEPFDGDMQYFADVYISEHTSTQTALLDRGSYRILKNYWMRCKIEPLE